MMTTQVRTLREDESINEADWDMVIGGFRHIPVVDREHRLVGLVSDRDVRHRINSSRSVAATMTRDVHTVLATTPAIEAIEYLLMAKQNALPVVDESRMLIGIVTTTDFLELARRALVGLDVNKPHVRG
ncbi:MAG TPA: CBS domain-containing protein [Kofleriaceae bacterium]|nr:CBS domain-containing protein [Kofleriaceae bacterium]